MSFLKSELVKRKVSDLKPDPEQPRKKFNTKDINLLAQTLKSQGVINPIEIDENNIIITGEMRWRASKIAFKNGELIDCKLLTEISEKEKRERQIVENEHNTKLTPEERENAIQLLWDTKEYKKVQDLGDVLGISGSAISVIIKANETRDSLKTELPKSHKTRSIPTKTMQEIGTLNKTDQIKVIQKIEEENIPNFKARELVTKVKKLPKKVKAEVLKPKSKITIEEAEEVAKLPEDIQDKAMKKEITIDEAKEVSEFPKKEQREAIIKQIKQTKKAGDKLIQQKKDIVLGKKQPKVKIVQLDTKFINAWKNTKIIDIPIKIKKKFLESYSQETKQECLRIVKSIVDYLIKEFSEDVNILE